MKSQAVIDRQATSSLQENRTL